MSSWACSRRPSCCAPATWCPPCPPRAARHAACRVSRRPGVEIVAVVERLDARRQVIAMGEGADDARAWRVLETAEMLARGLPSALVRV